MRLTKRKWQPNRLLWLFFLCYFNIALFSPGQAFSENHYLFTNLSENQIPIAMSNNGTILIEDRNDPDSFIQYILANGVKIPTPEGVTIHGLNELDSQSPALAVVGSTLINGTTKAHYWQLLRERLNSLETVKWSNPPIQLGPNWSEAIGINRQGIVIGQSLPEADEPLAFYNNIDNPTDNYNPVIRDYQQSQVKAVNTQGDFVGAVVDDNSVSYGYVYRKGQVNIIDNSREALDINDKGQIVGSTLVSTNQHHAYVLSNENETIMIDIGTLGGDNSVARGINNEGDMIVGQSQDSEGQYRAFLYKKDQTLVDLNEQVKLPKTTYRLTDAIAISDLGIIVGTFMNRDKPSGYILTPTINGPPLKITSQEINCQPTEMPCLADFSAQSIATDSYWIALGQSAKNQVTLLKRKGDQWFFDSILQPDAEVNNQFGISVALQKGRLVVGANYDDSAGTAEETDVGAIYVYDYNNVTATWNLDRKILPGQVISDLRFGSTVRLYDDRISVISNNRNYDLPGFYYVKSNTGWQELIINKSDGAGNADWIHLGASFAVFGPTSSVAIYPVTDSGQLEILPTLLSLPKSVYGGFFNGEELHGDTIAGTVGGSSRPIGVFQYENNKWHYQTQINQFSSSRFTGVLALYEDTLVIVSNDSKLNIFKRSQNIWYLQTRHPIKFNPRSIILNDDVLVMRSNNSTTPIEILSLRPPTGINLELTVDPAEHQAKIGTPITYEVTITNRDTQREAWGVHLEIDINNDLLGNSDPFPCALSKYSSTKVDCKIGDIPATETRQFSLTLLGHVSPEISFKVIQSGPNDPPNIITATTQFLDSEIAVAITTSQAEVAINSTVEFTLTVRNQEATLESVLIPIILRFDASVAYVSDSCELVQSKCRRVIKPKFGSEKIRYYIVQLQSNESSIFTVRLRFPTVGNNYDITLEAPEPASNPPRTATTSIKVGDSVPNIRFRNHQSVYTLSEGDSMPAILLSVDNWNIENLDTGRHIDWTLSPTNGAAQTDHVLEAPISLGALSPGTYTLTVELIDRDHIATGYQDSTSFTMQRPPPKLTIIEPKDSSTLRLAFDEGVIMQLAIENWLMSPNGKRYRWNWDNGNYTGENTSLTLPLDLPAEVITAGSHQLIVTLVDESDEIQPISQTTSFTIYHPSDVSLRWQPAIPETVNIEQMFPVALTLINNNTEAPATDIVSTLTYPATLLTLTSLPPNCNQTTSEITCSLPSLGATLQHNLDFEFRAIKQGNISLIVTVEQADDPDPTKNQIQTDIQIINPIDLSIESTWPVTEARINQTLKLTFTVTNQHPDRTATALTTSGTSTLLLSQHPSFNLSSECEIKGNTWQCTINTLAPGESRAFDWSFIAKEDGTIDYQVTVSSNTQDDTNLNNNTHTTEITLTQPSPKITIFQPTSTQTIYRHPLPSPINNTTYASSIQLYYRIDDWDQSERGIPHQVTINGELVVTRNAVSPLDITYNVIDGNNTIVIQLLERDNKPIIDSEARTTLTVAEGTIVDVPEPLVSTRGALGGWLLLGMVLLGWRRLRRLSI